MMRNTAEDSLLSSSPTSVLLVDDNKDDLTTTTKKKTTTITLQEFLERLPTAIISEQSKSQTSQHQQQQQNNENDGPIAKLMESLVLDDNDLKLYAHFDASRNYTRNLVHTDNARYTLLLLCWNPSKASPVHDHPCDAGCWMKVVSGSVFERRYVVVEKEEENDSSGRMKCVSDHIYQEGQLAYIHDSMGYHCVGSSSCCPAMTLHLYCPPFDSCKIWLDPEHSSKSINSAVCYYSEYGQVL